MLRPADETVDTSLSVTQVGLDSLMAIELRRWFRVTLGIQTSVLEIMGAESLAHLGRLIAEKLKGKLGSK